MKRNVILFGFMGTGKTSVGRILSDILGLTFLDMDQEIADREGRAITDIFAQNGEPYFRALERALVVELAAKSGFVIATGGGVVLNPSNIEDFSRTGLAVCLNADVDTILARLEGDTSRPLLAQGDKRLRALALLDKRRECYARVPHQVDTVGKTAATVAESICALYRAL